MTLSEAIRLGAMLKPQNHYGALFENGATCAVGAAVDACGALNPEDIKGCYRFAVHRFPILREYAWHPLEIRDAERHIEQIVFDLNDSAEWTREQIADWVATVEAQHEATTEQPQPAVSVEV
jgi:hypothetical protein